MDKNSIKYWQDDEYSYAIVPYVHTPYCKNKLWDIIKDAQNKTRQCLNNPDYDIVDAKTITYDDSTLFMHLYRSRIDKNKKYEETHPIIYWMCDSYKKAYAARVIRVEDNEIAKCNKSKFSFFLDRTMLSLKGYRSGSDFSFLRPVEIVDMGGHKLCVETYDRHFKGISGAPDGIEYIIANIILWSFAIVGTIIFLYDVLTTNN